MEARSGSISPRSPARRSENPSSRRRRELGPQAPFRPEGLIRDPEGPIRSPLGRLSANPAAENIENIQDGYQYYISQVAGKDPDWIRVYILGEYGTSFDGKAVYEGLWEEPRHLAREPLEVLRGLPVSQLVWRISWAVSSPRGCSLAAFVEFTRDWLGEPCIPVNLTAVNVVETIAVAGGDRVNSTQPCWLTESAGSSAVAASMACRSGSATASSAAQACICS